MKVSKAGLDIIKKYEGCRLTAYKDPIGIWTIGWGHTANVKEGQTITQAQADEMLEKEVQHFADGVDRLVTVTLNQNQLDALTSFAYNCGLGNLEKSTLLRLVNRKEFEAAALEFAKWNKAGGNVLLGLTRRRESERALFVKPVSTVLPKTSFQKAVDKGIFKGDANGDLNEHGPLTRSQLAIVLDRLGLL